MGIIDNGYEMGDSFRKASLEIPMRQKGVFFKQNSAKKPFGQFKGCENNREDLTA